MNKIIPQIVAKFPSNGENNKDYSFNRRTFNAYNNSFKIRVENHSATNADLYVNGVAVSLDKTLSSKADAVLEIGELIQDGCNTLKVLNIQPDNAFLNVYVPFSKIKKAGAADVGFNSEKLDRIDALINSEIEEGFPGAVLQIIKDGKMIKQTAYGYKRKFADGGEFMDKFDPMETNTLFDIASNSKMYSTNFALMKLASEGKLDVNRPVKEYIKEYSGDRRDIITVKDLLNHIAGYAPEVHFFLPDNDVGPEFHSMNRDKTIDLLKTKVPFLYEKGKQTIYSDTDYMLLGLIIESITGMRQDEYVENEIYKPLGLKDTMYVPLRKGRVKSEFAATEIHGTTRGHRRDYPGIRTDVLQGEAHDEKGFYAMDGIAGHAGLFSTVHDLGILTQVMLNRGGYGDIKIFDKNVLDQFVKPSDFDITFGLGWRRAGNGDMPALFGSYASSLAVGHTGWVGTATVIDPYYNLSIVLLTNKKHSENYGNDPFPLEKFKGDDFITGQYGGIVSLVYEAFLENN